MREICLVAVDVRSTYNVGSLFRTADGFSASVILVGITPRPLGGSNDDRLPYVQQRAHSSIAKTSLGAEIIVNWKYFITLADAIDWLKVQGYQIAAIEQTPKSKNIINLPRENKLALILGRERSGLTEEELSLTDDVYEIPMSGSKESFNVAVAAGIVLYQASIK